MGTGAVVDLFRSAWSCGLVNNYLNCKPRDPLLHAELSHTSEQLREHKRALESLMVENGQLEEELWEQKRRTKTTYIPVLHV